MNLRKDHCRILPSRMTRELVTNSMGTVGSFSHRPSTPGSHGRLERSGFPGGTTNPGAECAKELEQESDAPITPDMVREWDAVQPPIIIHNDSRQRISRLSHR